MKRVLANPFIVGVVVLSHAGILLASSLVAADAGAASSPMPDEIAQELNYFVGDWELEGAGAKGPMRSSWRIQWAPGNHCLMVEYRRPEPNKLIFGIGLWAWDSATNEIVYHALYSDPGLEHIRTKVNSPGVLEGRYTGSLEGKSVEGTCVLRKEGADRWTFKTEGVAASGLEELDVRFIRTASLEKEPGADDYIAMQQNYFAGQWKTTVIEGEGAGSTGTWTCEMDACGKSFHHTATADGKPFFQAVGGYDPQLKALKEVAFYVDGSTATLVYRNPLSTIQGSLVGKVLKGTMERVSADGKRELLGILVTPAERDKSVLTIHRPGDPNAIVVKVVFERTK